MNIAQVKSRVCLKRLLDEPQDVLPKVKRARLVPPPLTAGLSPCFTPKNSASKSSPSKSPSKVGPYLLLERCEGEETYKAVHAHTQEQYTCQVTHTHTGFWDLQVLHIDLDSNLDYYKSMPNLTLVIALTPNQILNLKRPSHSTWTCRMSPHGHCPNNNTIFLKKTPHKYSCSTTSHSRLPFLL